MGLVLKTLLNINHYYLFTNKLNAMLICMSEIGLGFIERWIRMILGGC